MKSETRVTLAILLLAVTLILTGCAGDRIAGTESGSEPAVDASQPRLLHAPAQAVPLGAAATSATKRIKAKDGGDLSVGEIKVHFDRFVLASDADLTLELLDQEQVRFRVSGTDLPLRGQAQITVNHLSNMDSRAFRSVSLFQVDSASSRELVSMRWSDSVVAGTSRLGEFGAGEQRWGNNEVHLLRYLSGPGYLTQLIDAGHGGDMRFDRFRLTFPGGALTEDTYITIRDPGNSYLMCDLEPEGLRFLRPVTLVMNVHGLDYQPYTDWSIFYLNESSGLWEDQQAVFANELLTASLRHFSTYAGGRAGW
jgi:hypothetical protein